MEVVLVAMSPHHHPQQILFTKEEYWHKKFVQIWQSSTKHSLDLEAMVLDFREEDNKHRRSLLMYYQHSLKVERENISYHLRSLTMNYQRSLKIAKR